VNVIYFCDGSEVSSIIIHVVQLIFMSFYIVRKKISNCQCLKKKIVIVALECFVRFSVQYVCVFTSLIYLSIYLYINSPATL